MFSIIPLYVDKVTTISFCNQETIVIDVYINKNDSFFFSFTTAHAYTQNTGNHKAIAIVHEKYSVNMHYGYQD